MVGGGVIGLTIAYELSGRGAKVTVVDSGRPGREASWAGAGMLPPGKIQPDQHPGHWLRACSAERWPKFSDQLRELTGVDNGYRNSGGLEVRFAEQAADLQREITFWRAEGVEIETLDRQQLLQFEQRISPKLDAGYHLPGFAQVRNPRQLQALMAACASQGVQLLHGTPVIGWEREGERIVAARTGQGIQPADQFCITAGAWSRGLLDEFDIQPEIEPVRGQIVLLNMHRPSFRHVIQIGSRYLVPRPDGRILIGSTEEWVGFDRRTTAEGVRDLINFALSIVPSLVDVEVERTWAGLRPGSPDGLPYLGLIPQTSNLFLAAGHFRNGLQMSPATAFLIAELMDGKPAPVDLSALSPTRHG